MRKEKTLIFQTQVMMNKYALIDQLSAMDFFAKIPNEQAVREHLENARWPNGTHWHEDAWKIRGGMLYG